MRLLSYTLCLTLLSAGAFAADKTDTTCVQLDTSLGTVTIELLESQAPVTSANFLKYVDNGFYNGTIFHRVIANFMVQGGGFDRHGSQKRTKAPIKNESANGLKNQRGMLAMARTSNPDSATSQFFINVVNNTSLDYRPGHPGYAVFGQVVNGMKTVDAIATSSTHVGSLNGYGTTDVPVKPIIIQTASRTTCPTS